MRHVHRPWITRTCASARIHGAFARRVVCVVGVERGKRRARDAWSDYVEMTDGVVDVSRRHRARCAFLWVYSSARGVLEYCTFLVVVCAVCSRRTSVALA